MRSVLHAFGLALLIALTSMAGAREPKQDDAISRLKPVPAGAKAIEVAKRPTSHYSAVSGLQNTDTRDGIGVRWNIPQKLGDKNWGKPDTVSLVAFPNEPVAFGKDRGFVVRLINRTKKPVSFEACDSALYLIQEAKDENGRWREIEESPWSTCGNSYHQVLLDVGEYWEFAAPEYGGGVKTKIRFRLDARRETRTNRGNEKWVYSNEFDGRVAQAQFSMAPTEPEIRRAFASKNAKDVGVVATLIELLDYDKKNDESRRILRASNDAIEGLGKLGPDAKAAIPALQRIRDREKGEKSIWAAHAIWRIDGKVEPYLKTLMAVLQANEDKDAVRYVAYHIGELGRNAMAAVPLLCSVADKDGPCQEAAIYALGEIRSLPVIAVPCLIKG